MRAPGAATVRLLPGVAIALPRHWRRRLTLALVALVALGAAYYGWFRDSSFVSVSDVTIAGLETPGTARLRAELESAATRMTSLHVDEDALRAAVHGDPLVRSLSASGHFPHALEIDVTLNTPVAVLASGGRSLAVASDGTLLPDGRADLVPAIYVGALPHQKQLGQGRALRLVGLASATPVPLRPRVEALYVAPGRGVVAQLRRGPLVIFGDASETGPQWTAAASVLANPTSAGASYVDVRDPAHPIAGGLVMRDQPQASAVADPSNPAAPGAIPAAPGGASAPLVGGQSVPPAAAGPGVPGALSSGGVSGAAAASNPHP